MKKKIAAMFLSALMACTGTVSCSKSKTGSREGDSSAASDTTTENPQFTEPETISSETEKAAVTEPSTVPAVTTKPAVESATKNPSETAGSGYTDSLTLASDFYQAYLDHDPKKVYKMFSSEEIECYKRLMTDELEGKSSDEVFSEDAVTKAIDDSMYMIEEIMKEFSDSENDRWTADITSELFTEADDEELAGFNEELGTNYTSGVIINYMYYVNADNGELFVGNSSAFLEKNGQWYVSFSSLMQSELINQLEV